MGCLEEGTFVQAAAAVDLRKHPRLPVQVAVQLDTAEHTFVGYTKDISWGGAFIETLKTFTRNALVAVSLHIPEAAYPLEFDARVTHLRSGRNGDPGGVGLEFLTITERHRPALAGFLQNLSAGDGVLS